MKQVTVKPYGRSNIPVFLTLPDKPGGYLILSEFIQADSDEKRLSRRYIKVGESELYTYFEIDP